MEKWRVNDFEIFLFTVYLSVLFPVDFTFYQQLLSDTVCYHFCYTMDDFHLKTPMNVLITFYFFIFRMWIMEVQRLNQVSDQEICLLTSMMR